MAKVERRFKRRGLIQSGTQGDIGHLIAMRDTISEITGIEHHLGHIHPVTHTLICGLHTPKNIVIEPAYVNLSHSNRFVPYRVIFNGSSVRYMELSGYTWLPQDKPSWHPIISVNNLI